MSTPLAEQLKPLLQRLLTMAESHDERLARLEAAHSRLGTQMARVGEQLTRQSDQLSRIEEAPAGPAQVVVRPPAPIESSIGGRFGEQVGRINEQVTRVREQFGRMLEQLSRIEQVQGDLRDEAGLHGDEQRRLLERLETTLVRHQDEIVEQIPDRVAQRLEISFAIGDAEEAEIAAPPAASEPPPAPELTAVQEQIRHLGDRIADLAEQLSKLSNPPPPAPTPTPAPTPVATPAPTPVRPVVIRPVVTAKQVSR